MPSLSLSPAKRRQYPRQESDPHIVTASSATNGAAAIRESADAPFAAVPEFRRRTRTCALRATGDPWKLQLHRMPLRFPTTKHNETRTVPVARRGQSAAATAPT